MTFVNHQPARLHQQTLPADTPFNTKAVAMPFKKGSLKAPLCGREEKQHTHTNLSSPCLQPPKNFRPFRNTITKCFQLSVSFRSFRTAYKMENQESKPEVLKNRMLGASRDKKTSPSHLQQPQFFHTLMLGEGILDAGFRLDNLRAITLPFCYKSEGAVEKSLIAAD